MGMLGPRLWTFLVVASLCAGRAAAKGPGPHESRTARALSHGGCHITPTSYRGKILVAGAANIKPSAEECRSSCGNVTECTAWTWCADEDACPDERGVAIPFHGCQLKDEPLEPWGLPDAAAVKRFQPSTYASGYVKRRKPAQQTFIRMHSAPETSLLITTFTPHDGCTAEQGPNHALLAVMNKQDYARWHSYEFWLGSRQDVSLRPKDAHDASHWSKVAELQRILAETPRARAEWIMYMTDDAVLDDIAFTIPFEKYQGKDVVLIGYPDRLKAGDAAGTDLGVVLLRNSAWSRHLLKELVLEAGRMEIPDMEDAKLNDAVVVALTKAIQRSPMVLDRLHFEGDFCLSCDWKRIDLAQSSKVEVTKTWGEENKRWKLFITRFYKCHFCYAGHTAPEDLAACRTAFQEHYEYAFCRFHRMERAIRKEAEVGGPLAHLGELGVPQHLLSFIDDPTPIQPNRLLADPVHHLAPSAQECYERCLADAACDVWTWCTHLRGCDNAGEFAGRLPHHGCQLAALPQARGPPGLLRMEGCHAEHENFMVVTGEPNPVSWDRGPMFSSYASGYISGARDRRRGRHHGAGAEAERIVMLTGIPTAPCTTPYGDFFLSLAIQNKQDWARLHATELQLMAESFDPKLRPGAWQKIALIRQALTQVPPERAEWILWLDMDLIIADIGFTFPLEKYRGYDVVLWGQPEKVKQGDVAAMNSGVWLLRNNDFSRRLIAEMAVYGGYPIDYKKEEMLRSELAGYEVGMFEQNPLTYIFMKNPDIMERVYFDNHDYCMNCWYKNIYDKSVRQPAFIVHFAGCQMCNGFHPEKLGECDAEYVKIYAEAFGRVADEAKKAIA